MNKLNRKGFTLVELLAVIIILAIVVGITIPAILTTTQKAREKAFQTSIESFANWLDRQYEAYLLNNDLLMQVDPTFREYCVDENGIKSSCTISDELLKAGGLKPNNYDSSRNKEGNNNGLESFRDYNEIKLKDGKFCVRLFGNPEGDYNTSESKTNNAECFPKKVDEIPGRLSKIGIDDGRKKKKL